VCDSLGAAKLRPVARASKAIARSCEGKLTLREERWCGRLAANAPASSRARAVLRDRGLDRHRGGRRRLPSPEPGKTVVYAEINTGVVRKLVLKEGIGCKKAPLMMQLSGGKT